MTLSRELEEFVTEHQPHGELTGDAGEPRPWSPVLGSSALPDMIASPDHGPRAAARRRLLYAALGFC